ncbi:unnamed protein product [Bemisia tabaci]|uniref:Uncharacterized protein n=1 Tax=Bemisia tabaci TaxID=7038 RepID=A0A9P0A875_BEMTA|nr:unnamed protein product [Bemisia tabaci]
MSDSTSAHYFTKFIDFRRLNGLDVIQANTIDSANFLYRKHGFVCGVLDAYNRHYNLSIRPDDVWLAIMSQFSFHFNANAETYRSQTVAHEGKAELVAESVGTLHTANYALLVESIVGLMRGHLKDADLCDWALPSFSTTTDNDRIVGSVMLMATCQKFFDYKICLACGIPKIEILGTVDDWKDIRGRISKLKGYGEHCVKWSEMLTKILDEFVKATDPDCEADMDFWRRICHHTSGGSGPAYLSGWISAFAVFSAKGVWQGDKFSMKCGGERIDGLDYPVIDTGDIPSGYAVIEKVTVDDNGKTHDCFMFAGHTGYHATDNGYCVSPQLSWGLCTKGDASEGQHRLGNGINKDQEAPDVGQLRNL